MVTDKTIPQYRRLYEILRKHILDSVYREGDLLPSENELCQLYGMTRPTVRQALGTLANDGYIRKHQGKGSIVHHLPKEIGILSVSGTTSALGDRNLKTEIIVRPVLTQWPDDFMFPLTGLEKESGCINMERLRLLDDSPIFYDISYIANINLPRITARKFENRSLFQILREHYGVEIKGGDQRIKAIRGLTENKQVPLFKKGSAGTASGKKNGDKQTRAFSLFLHFLQYSEVFNFRQVLIDDRIRC